MDKIFVNGKIHSLDRMNNDYEAMGIKDGLLCALGSNKDVLKLKNENTEVFDLYNQVVFPGFIDSHMHILEYAMQAKQVDLSHVKSINELILVMKTALNEHSNNENNTQWLIGSCFNQDHFDEKMVPTREDLNKISTTIPIVIFRVCLHIAVVNDKALELLCPGGALPFVDGGDILLGEDNVPNGILTENALQLIYATQSKPSISQAKELIQKAANELASYGITSVHSDDFGSVKCFEDAITAYRELGEEKLLKVRVTQQCLIKESKELLEFINKGYAAKKCNSYYSLGALKILSDGSLGARTAYLRKPYHDDHNTRGIFIETKQQLMERMRLAHDNGMQIAVHAIGDAAIEAILDCFEELEINDVNLVNIGEVESLVDINKEETRAKKNHLRHGIVHCQITDSALLERFKNQDVLAYIQPIFLEYDLHMVEDRVGKELAYTSYAFKTLMDSGVHTSGGSDCPVEHFNVMNNIYCAVTRKDLLGQPVDGFNKKEALTMQQALLAFTIKGAYASREEHIKGSLEIGKYADFVVLDKDLLDIENEEIRNVNVLMTVLGGEITFCNEGRIRALKNKSFDE